MLWSGKGYQDISGCFDLPLFGGAASEEELRNKGEKAEARLRQDDLWQQILKLQRVYLGTIASEFLDGT